MTQEEVRWWVIFDRTGRSMPYPFYPRYRPSRGNQASGNSSGSKLLCLRQPQRELPLRAKVPFNKFLKR